MAGKREVTWGDGSTRDFGGRGGTARVPLWRLSCCWSKSPFLRAGGGQQRGTPLAWPQAGCVVEVEAAGQLESWEPSQSHLSTPP